MTSIPRMTLDDEPAARTSKKAPKKKYRYYGRRPRKRLNPSTIERMAVLTRDGCSMTEIANSMCIPVSMLTEWKRRGEIFDETGGPPEWEIEGELLWALKVASGRYIVGLTRKMHKKEDWFRRLKIAERRQRDVWAVNPPGGADEVMNPDDGFL